MIIQQITKEILESIAEDYQTELLFGPEREVNGLTLLPILELVICSAGFTDKAQGSGVYLKPKAIIIVKEDGQVSTITIDKSKCNDKIDYSELDIDQKLVELMDS